MKRSMRSVLRVVCACEVVFGTGTGLVTEFVNT